MSHYRIEAKRENGSSARLGIHDASLTGKSNYQQSKDENNSSSL